MPNTAITPTRLHSSASASRYHTATKPHANCPTHPLATPPHVASCNQRGRTPHTLQTSTANASQPSIQPILPRLSLTLTPACLWTTSNPALTQNLAPNGANPMPTNSDDSVKALAPTTLAPTTLAPTNASKVPKPSTSSTTTTSPSTDAQRSPSLKSSAKSAQKNQTQTAPASPLAETAYATRGM
eukprot:CCRYP_012519-RA/>CCRYP_012519-RA protein AED:0.43 eAED:1.00 QI:0/0/0/1/0/0/2/0/184